jgi:hypothetical protein
MNSTSLFDMMFLACSEDKALLESNLSAVAGGRPIGRGYFLAAAFSFFKYRDTPKAVNSCHSYSDSPGNSGLCYQTKLNYLSHFWGSVQKDLEWVAKYVRNQREHHKQGNVFDRMERIVRNDD